MLVFFMCSLLSLENGFHGCFVKKDSETVSELFRKDYFDEFRMFPFVITAIEPKN